MRIQQNPKSFKHFSKHLFVIGKVYVEKHRAKEDLDEFLRKMRKSIIRMNLKFTDIDRLKAKIENLLDLERQYAKFFKSEDKEISELKSHIKDLEEQLKNEREEKLSIMTENEEKINQLKESLNNIKSKMRHLLMERAKRQQRLNILEHKIDKGVDVHNYYQS